MLASESSLVTTAASDTSSSADSRYRSSRARRGSFSVARSVQSSRIRRCYNLKARGVVIGKVASQSGGSQKVRCACKACKGQRLVSKSTCYRHLRVEAEVAEDEFQRWSPYMSASHLQALRMYSIMHLAGIRLLGF